MTASIPSGDKAVTPSMSTGASGASYRGPFAIMTVLFFMWGFMTVWNDILIPRFKEAFTLNYFSAMLVQFAFFGAYAIGSLVYYLVSMIAGDPINRIGYKNGVLIGLCIAAVGSALFYPAAVLTSYPFFLIALFIVGLGFAMLQIAANPYVTILGPERTASSRLNLSQAFNSFGTTIGPLIGGWLIFTVFTHPGMHGADSVKIPYLCFAAVFLLLALFFQFAHLPSFTNPEPIGRGLGALKHPHTALGMLAIFMYVGGEVSVGSAIINFLGTEKLGSLSQGTASRFLSFYWGGLMIGRFMGAFALSELREAIKDILVVLVPAVALLVILNLSGTGTALHYGLLLIVLLVAFSLGESSPHRMLALFSVVIIALLGAGVLASGELAKWAILGIGLFCSVMWSNVFSLAIEGLGPLKSQGSSLLVMAILGGALLPPLQGAFADRFGIQTSFVVPIVAFAYVAFYGLCGYRAGRTSTAATEKALAASPEVLSEPAARPVFLGVIAALGMVGAGVGMLVGVVVSAGGDLFALAVVGVDLLVLAVSLGLWFGRYWALVAYRRFLILSILLSVYGFLFSLFETDAVHSLTMITAVESIIMAVPSTLLLFYVYTKAVVGFCVVGRHS